MMNNTGLRVIGLSFIICHLSFSGVAAQNESAYRLADATQLWRQTDNAAGLWVDNGFFVMDFNRGYSQFTLQHTDGDYHRVQEGNMNNQLSFFTERYQTIGQQLRGYGRFNFGMDRTKQRSWADVMRPYNSNPFFGGSSVAGKYDTQQMDLSASLSYKPMTLSKGLLAMGMRLDYSVADLSRLRDPRSRSELLDYRLTPAVIYTFDRLSPTAHTLGLALHYDRRKEKIPNMTTVQQDPNLMYYQMTGLEQASGVVGGYQGFNREWVNHEFGGELTYSIRTIVMSSLLNSLTSVAVAHGTEDVWGTYKYEPGRYVQNQYRLMSLNRLHKGYTLHQIDLRASYQEAYADEYRQQLLQEKDPETGFTSYHYDTQIVYKKRYQVKTFDMNLHYRWQSTRYSHHYVGATVDWQGAMNKRLLPVSELKHQRLNLQGEGGGALLKGALWLDGTVTYSHAMKSNLALADATTDYATQVLQPDMAYYKADYWQGHLEVKYQFPLIIKGNRTLWYVKVFGDYLHTDNSLDRKTVGASLGLYY